MTSCLKRIKGSSWRGTPRAVDPKASSAKQETETRRSRIVRTWQLLVQYTLSIGQIRGSMFPVVFIMADDWEIQFIYVFQSTVSPERTRGCGRVKWRATLSTLVLPMLFQRENGFQANFNYVLDAAAGCPLGFLDRHDLILFTADHRYAVVSVCPNRSCMPRARDMISLRLFDTHIKFVDLFMNFVNFYVCSKMCGKPETYFRSVDHSERTL